jgi:hypothetical protein
MSISEAAGRLQMVGQASERVASRSTLKVFWTCTALVWGGVGVCAVLFFVGVLDFVTSAKIGLYAISIWLNAWMLVFLLPQNKGRSRTDLYHDALVVWMLSYALTNALWEIPWVLFSPFVFENDLRTVNHNSTFYTLELYSFVNVLSVILFFYLNKKRSPYRYLIPVLGSGEPVASTFIFSFSEVFAGFENMSGGVADTLLALVWTQYQYFLFPLIFGYFGVKLLLEDWRHCHVS